MTGAQQKHQAGWARFRRPVGVAIGLFAICAAARPLPDNASPLPFSIGEKLTYSVTTTRTGKVGTATMWIEGPTDVRGARTYVLRFDSRIRIALMSAVSQSSSWFDPVRISSLRFLKQERNPLSHHDESVELFPERMEWKAADGEEGKSLTTTPLDELSFMYFVRTLPLAPATYQFNRFFDATRNPTTVTFVRHEVIPTPMGELKVFLVEMRVRDPRHYKGEGLIRIHITDDACKVPARIESNMPIVGTAVLTLSAATTHCQQH